MHVNPIVIHFYLNEKDYDIAAIAYNTLKYTDLRCNWHPHTAQYTQ
jgi:hypothetical protein